MSRQAEASHSAISAKQIAGIRRAFDHALPNGRRRWVISLMEEELVMIGEMLDDAEARISANTRLEEARRMRPHDLRVIAVAFGVPVEEVTEEQIMTWLQWGKDYLRLRNRLLLEDEVRRILANNSSETVASDI